MTTPALRAEVEQAIARTPSDVSAHCRKAAICVYIAVEAHVAEQLDVTLREAADTVDRLAAENAELRESYARELESHAQLQVRCFNYRETGTSVFDEVKELAAERDGLRREVEALKRAVSECPPNPGRAVGPASWIPLRAAELLRGREKDGT